jgi:hypothetical protein
MMANKWHLFGVYAVEEGIIVSKIPKNVMKIVRKNNTFHIFIRGDNY